MKPLGKLCQMRIQVVNLKFVTMTGYQNQITATFVLVTVTEIEIPLPDQKKWHGGMPVVLNPSN